MGLVYPRTTNRYQVILDLEASQLCMDAGSHQSGSPAKR